MALMESRKTVKRVVVVFLAAVVAAAAMIYVQAGRIPSLYKPAILTPDQRKRAAKEFLNRKILDEFGNAAQRNEPFEWVISEGELNRYLASIDEIAAGAPSVRQGTVMCAMADAGLAGPAVALRDGKVTLMARSITHEKVLSADVGFRFDADRKLAATLLAARLGRLALPDAVVRDRIDALKKLLAPVADSHHDDRSNGLVGVSALDIGQILRAVLTAIDSEPIPTDFTWRISRRRVRVADITIADGLLRLHIVPVIGRPAG